MLIRRMAAVLLVLILFVTLTFVGIAYTDYEIRRTGFGENTPLFLLRQDETGEVRLQLHIFGTPHSWDVTWVRVLFDRIRFFAQDYASPMR